MRIPARKLTPSKASRTGKPIITHLPSISLENKFTDSVIFKSNIYVCIHFYINLHARRKVLAMGSRALSTLSG